MRNMRIIPAVETGAKTESIRNMDFSQSEEFKNDFRFLLTLSGSNLFDSLKALANSKYSEELSVIAGSLLHDEFKDDILNDESKILTKVEIKEINGDGIDLEVVICSSSYCWLKLVHAPFPTFCRDADSLCRALLYIYNRAIHGKIDGQMLSDYNVLPEFLASARNLMNGEFVEYLEETVNKLGGSDSSADEHIKNVHVTSIDDEGFDCVADICRQLECHHLSFRVKFPRKAQGTQELQAEIVECLEEGACFIDWNSIHSAD